MVTRLDSSQVQPVAALGRTARLERGTDPRQEAMARALQPMLGKSMQAEVLARLTDGSALVRVAGHAARMQLPPGLPTGSQLAMTLVTVAPRPAFQLDGTGMVQPLLYPDAVPDGPDPAVSPLRLLQTAAQRPGQQPAGAAMAAPAVDDVPIRLSETARALAGVLAAAQRGPTAQSAVVAAQPLLPSPDAQPARLAAALQEAIGNSGLFYEAHLAEWAEGKRALPELLREPQMQRFADAPGPGPRQGPGAIDPAVAQLVNLQLATQEQGLVAWQGQLWPGQHMEWDVRKEESEKRRDGQDEAEPAWRSGLRLRFPLLGDIAGTLVLEDGRLHIRLQASSDASGALLRQHAGMLGTALDAAGSPLGSLTIRTLDTDANG